MFEVAPKLFNQHLLRHARHHALLKRIAVLFSAVHNSFPRATAKLSTRAARSALVKTLRQPSSAAMQGCGVPVRCGGGIA
jgi:hypothetical protein